MTITIQKPGFETATLVVVGSGGGTDTAFVIAGMAVVAVAAAYLLFGRKFLANKKAGKK